MPDLQEQTHDQAIDLLNAYRLPEADALCRRALRGVTEPVSRANLLCTLAHIREAQWKFASARKLYGEVLTLLRRKHGVAILRVKAWRGLGRMLRVDGDYPAAAILLRRAVRQAELLDNGRIELSDALGDLGVLYRYMGRLDSAIEIYQRALEISIAERGPADPAIAIFHHMLAGVNHVRGSLPAAEQHGREAVAIRSAALGPDHPDTVADAACLAAILIDQGNRDEAETILKHALKIFRHTYGDAHYEIAITLHNLASIAHSRKRWKTATKLFRESLAMKEKLLGDTHPDLAMTLNNLAVLESRQGNLAEARDLSDRALRIAEMHMDVHHPSRQLIRANAESMTAR